MTHAVLIAPSRSGHTFVQRMIESWIENTDVTLHRLENVHPRDMNGRINNGHDSGEPISINLIQTRGFLNWMASSCAFLFRNNGPGHWEYKIDRWVDHWTVITKEAYGITCYLEGHYTIRYESFRDSRATRVQLCQFLNGTYSEHMIDAVPETGNGSSFDGMKYDGRASKMRTDDRWRQILTNDSWRDAFIQALKRANAAWDLYEFAMQQTSDEVAFMTKEVWR
jgi:hypothetical protein